ncbi:fibronectin type III domain-containing protein [Patescibacteria group bacterium]|nr:fibronectin type III domain-containing protein [Patescibacteria group bacterium]
MFFGHFQKLAAIDTYVTVTPVAPENAAVVHDTLTEVVLSWDASPSPAFDIASYTVFYKPVTEPSYPLIPQITRTDSLADYSQNITVAVGVTYDFIVFANSVSGLKSTENCISCHTINTIPVCGNSVIEAGEDCDTANLGGVLCTDYGYIGGTLTCSGSCAFNFAACSSGGGGGGGRRPAEDSTPPNPGVAVSPAYANSSPIIVSYSNASDSGGSGLSYVTLLYKKGTNNWKNTGLKSSETSGSFEFIPDASPNAYYYFDLQAFDNWGNMSNYPVGTGDTSTIYDTQAPAIGTIVIPNSGNEVPFTISYKNAVDVGIAGLSRVELWYKQGEAGEWVNSGLVSTGKDGSFAFKFPDESGYYYFDLIAIDKAGNKSAESQEYASPVLYDTEPPVLESLTAAPLATKAPISINYTGAVDVGPAGLKAVELWYKKESSGVWTNSGLSGTTTDGNFKFTPAEGEGIYYFTAVLEDNLGNRSAAASGDGMLKVQYSELPFAAELSNLPAPISEIGSADIKVGGKDITAYKYKLNDAEYSEEIPVTQNIVLTDLPEGAYFLEVIGKNSLEQWQDVAKPTKYSWIVAFPEELPPPVAEEGEEEIEEEVPEEVAEEEVAEEGEPEELVPEVTPPAPGIHYAPEEFKEIAKALITQEEAKKIPFLVSLPGDEEENQTRLGSCRRRYPGIPFGSLSLDWDDDGISNRTECYLLTDPTKKDTDGDGCFDGDEINQFFTDPLNGTDCSPGERLGVISISNPQDGWLINELEITGLTPDTTSWVYFVTFPVIDNVVMSEQAIELGTVDQFSPYSIEGQNFFRKIPEVALEDGQTYDLMAIGILTGGQIITSNIVRFSFDSGIGIMPPIPTAIGNVSITEELKNTNIHVKANKDGKIEVIGKSEYGAQVFAVWESLVLASSVLSDSALGEFAMESPQRLSQEQDHVVTLYAVKAQDGQKLRSGSVDVNFYIEKPTPFPYWLILLLILLLLLMRMFFLYYRRRKEERIRLLRLLIRILDNYCKRKKEEGKNYNSDPIFDKMEKPDNKKQ